MGKDGTIRASNWVRRRSRRDTLFLTFDVSSLAPGLPLWPMVVGWPESAFWGDAGLAGLEMFKQVSLNT